MKGRNTVLGSLFAFCLVLPSFSVAAEAPTSAALQQQILDALSQGRDASALIAQFRQQQGTATGSPMPPRSDVYGELQQRLLVLEQVLSRDNASVDTVLSQYESVVAAHLLVKDRFDIVDQQLSDDSASSTITARNQNARAAYDQTMGELDAALGALLVEWQGNREVAATDAFRSRARSGITAANKVLADNSSRTPVQILRANTLPFRPASLAQRAPTLTPTIVPSYSTPIESQTPTQVADTSDSIDAPLGEEILKQARELNYDYIRIYEFVRNNVRTEWYAGSMKGAVGTLRQKSGNDVDQAALLIALFRASGLASRYVHGVIELPIEQVGSSLGLTDPQKVVSALQASGVAFSPVIRGGRVAAVNIEHTWVSAFAPYTNYRGAVVDGSGKTWVPLAPAIKQHGLTPFIAVFAQAALTATSLIDDYLGATQAGTLLANVQTRLSNYLISTGSPSTYEQVMRTTSVTAQTIGLLPNTLPVTVVAVTGESAVLDDAHRQRVRITVRQGDRESDKIIVDYTAPVSTLASERVTLSYMPATNDDHQTVNLFGGLDYTPAYLIKLRPQIKVNGRAKAVGSDSLSTGQLHRLAVQVISPARTETVEQIVTTGSYHAIGVYAQGVARVVPESDAGDTEFTAARLLDRIAYAYVDRWNGAERQVSSLLNVAAVHPLPHIAVVSNAIQAENVLGRVMSIQWKGVTLDAALRLTDPVARDSTANSARDFMRLSAIEGSALEQQIFADEFLVDSISADKGLRLARLAGQEILTVNNSNATAVLSIANLAPEVEADIANWARLGFTIEVPRNPVTHLDWTGAVWRVLDNTSGAAGYFIAGGLAGGATAAGGDSWILDFVRDALSAANTAEPNRDPLAATSVVQSIGDGQTGIVGQEFAQPLSVVVRDSRGRPVQGALVTFRVTSGGGSFVDATAPPEEEIPEVQALTNSLGVAWVRLRAARVIGAQVTYLPKFRSDDQVSKAAYNVVDATVLARAGDLSMGRPFQAVSFPDNAVAMVRTNSCCLSSPLPEAAIDIVNLQARDQFGNAVSNVPVQFTLTGDDDPLSGTPVHGHNGTLYGACDACGSGASLTFPTSATGASVTVVLGTNDFQHLRAVGIGTPYTINYRIYPDDSFAYVWTIIADAEGRNIAAARPGEELDAAVVGGWQRWDYRRRELTASNQEEVKHLNDDDGYEDPPPYNPAPWLPPSPVGAKFTAATWLYKGLYQSRMTMGPTPRAYVGKQSRIVYAPDNPDPTWHYPYRLHDFLIEAYGVLPVVTGVLSNGQPQNGIPLNDENLVQAPFEIAYTINPPNYATRAVTMEIMRGGQRVFSSPGSAIQGSGVAQLPRDGAFDISVPYTAQLVLNRGTNLEVRSEPFALPLRKRLFSDYTRDISVKQRVDVHNQRVCTIGDNLRFVISSAATVTLTARDVSNPSFHREIFSRSFPAGANSVAILPADISAGRYTFVLRGETSDGRVEEVDGALISEYVVQDAAPVGQVMVKNVNVQHGQLVLGATDLAVPGRGNALEFRRTYASNAGYSPGSLGVRWSHNYNSSVEVESCGEVVVNGGDGSGMRFVDDGNGGLRPLKGYHGTLIANASDSTFDFYSKDGTRWHYRRFAPVPRWDLEFIQDTNGNYTKLGYDPSSTLVPKVIVVEDSSGRKLNFSYENRQYASMKAPVATLTKVEGPDGMSVKFTYDAQGNLITAEREGIKIERYAYTPIEQSTVKSQVLETYTDPNGHATNYTYNEGTVSVSPGGMATIQLPNAFVTQVRDAENGNTYFSYDQAQWQHTTVTDARNHETVYNLNAVGNPLSIVEPAGTTRMTWSSTDVLMLSKTDANGVRTEFTHDANGNVLTETVAGASTVYTYESFNPPYIKNRVRTKRDREGRTTTFGYDSRGNLISERNAENGLTTHTFASNGDRMSTRDPRGNETLFVYDRYGNIEKTTDALGGVVLTEFNVRSMPMKITDPLGRVTRLEYDTLGRMVKRTNALNRSREYTYDAVGNKLSERDENNHTTRWTYDDVNRITRIDNAAGDHTTIGYDLIGNKTSESDWRGNVTTLAYDNANRLITRTEPLGKVTQFTYDAVGNVLTERNPLNHTTTHEYDALNRRIKTTDAQNGEWLFGYDAVGNKTSERDALLRSATYTYDGLNRLTRKTEPLGRVSQLAYDANGNTISETDANGNVRGSTYDALNRVIQRRDAYGNTTVLEYDAVGNQTLQIDPRLSRERYEYDALNRRTKRTDAGGFVTAFEYDDVGNKTAEVWANGNRVTFVYDAVNRLASTSDSLGFISSTEYDADGRPTVLTDANSHSVTNTYDELGRHTRVQMPEARTVNYGYDLVGNKTSEIDGRNFKTQFAYDELNRLIRVTDPLTHSVAYTYDPLGNKLTETDKRNNTTNFQYDALGRLVQVTDPLTNTTSFTYDLVGNKKSETDKRGTLTTYNYDKENRLAETTKNGVRILFTQYDEVGNKEHETDANGNVSTFVYDIRGHVETESRPLAAVSRFKYNSVGDRIEVRDPENRISTVTYDLRRRVLTQTDAASQQTAFTYDGVGNRLTVRKPKGNTWTSTFDDANRLSTITDPTSGVTRFTYDGNNNKLTQVDGRNNTTSYEYDEINRQTAMVYADSRRVEFRYDNNGNRIGLTDAKGLNFSYTFDALSRETLKTYPLPAPSTGDDIQTIANVYDNNGNLTRVTETYTGTTGARVTTNTYDVFDRLTERTDAFGERLTYQFDANGNRVALTDSDGVVTRYAFDSLNRVTSVTNAAGVTTYEYDRSSLPTRTTYPNGTLAINTYDNAKRVATVSNRQGQSTISTYSYTYDLNGNRLTQQEANGGLPQNTTYTYDDDDRLLTVAYPDKTTTYTYDATYNRATEVTVTASDVTEANKTFSYNSRNQLTAIADSTNAANNVAYDYDFNGNQTIKTKNGSTTTFAYDVRDQLISVTENVTTLGLFRYDYQGLRVRKDMGAQIVRYTYDQDSVLMQSDNTGVTIAKYDYGADRLLSLTHVSEGRQFYLFDALGSVSNLATQSGTVQARYQYDAFGNLRSTAGSSYNRFTFTGHEKDTETGLFYFKARFYDPEVGRFLSQDSYLGEAGTPPSLHRYLYAYSNPTVFIDLNGYQSTEPVREYGYSGFTEPGKSEEGRPKASQPQEMKSPHVPYEVWYFVYATDKQRADADYRGAVMERDIAESNAASTRARIIEEEAKKREAAGVSFEKTPGQKQLAEMHEAGNAAFEYVGTGFDMFAGAVNPAKGAHDLYMMANSISEEDLQKAWAYVKDNPAKSGVAAVLAAACIARCSNVARSMFKGGDEAASSAGSLERRLDLIPDNDFRGVNIPPKSNVGGGKLSVYNARTSPGVTQSVVDGIDASKFKANEGRFGGALYTAEKGETAVLEVNYHAARTGGAEATHVIRFEVDMSKLRVADFSDAKIAEKFGYNAADDYALTRQAAQRAQEMGYTAIKFPSVRGEGNNYAIFDVSPGVLKPQMVMPAK